MEQVVLIIHFFIALVLIVLVLIQRGKGATMGAAFGSGASSTVFGSKGSGGFLLKLTMGIGILFFLTSISLTYIAARQAKATQNENVINNVEQIAQLSKQQPVTEINNNIEKPKKV